MNYDPTLESRPHAPLVNPIPMVEMVIPMPGSWLDEMNEHGVDPGRAVAEFCCQMLHYSVPCPVSVRDDFPHIWGKSGGFDIPVGEAWKQVLVPIRRDAWQCLEAAAAMVGRSVHEVFLKVLARQLPIFAESEKEIRERTPRRNAGYAEIPSNVMQGPWLAALA
jgi:hypothetical protein